VTTGDPVATRPPGRLAPIPSYGRVFDSTFAPTDGHERIHSDWPLLPWPRGPLSATVVSALQRQPGTLGVTPPISQNDPLSDDDFELALYLCYEMHYRGLADVEWEWDPGLIKFRTELERAFEQRLRDELGPTISAYPREMVTMLDQLVEDFPGTSLLSYFNEVGTIDQFREFCVHRSAYQLRAAHPQTLSLPRRSGEAKAALVEVPVDESDWGEADRMRAHLFATTMIALGLDDSYGSYVEILPGVTLATVNLASMFSFHPQWRAALVGHLAVSETTSMESMERYGNALSRFGVDPVGRRFADRRVAVDERRPLLARNHIVAGLLGAAPQLSADLLFGAAAVLMLEQRFADHLLGAWSQHRSSLVPWELYPREPTLP
jgi:Iron-containing redox enzyme